MRTGNDVMGLGCGSGSNSRRAKATLAVVWGNAIVFAASLVCRIHQLSVTEELAQFIVERPPKSGKTMNQSRLRPDLPRKELQQAGRD